MTNSEQDGEQIFLLEALRKFKQIGSILPSSKYLGKSMAKFVSGKEGFVVVELGAGTGVITKEILKKLSKTGRLIAFENNKDLAEYLRQNIMDPRLIVLEKNVLSMKKYLNDLGYSKVDCIISGLPLGTIKKSDRTKILETIQKLLKKDGAYIQFQYFLSSLSMIKKHFSRTKIKNYELRNFPPAFVYECKK
ncbi:methyltransferase domain-containing protein [Patescibacteria group bacterium]|nr:methyltransferase domain-containing protein [Patescibacteria group bacterium]